MPASQIHDINVISDLQHQNTVRVFRMQLLGEETTLLSEIMGYLIKMGRSSFKSVLVKKL